MSHRVWPGVEEARGLASAWAGPAADPLGVPAAGDGAFRRRGPVLLRARPCEGAPGGKIGAEPSAGTSRPRIRAKNFGLVKLRRTRRSARLEMLTAVRP
jgi:hypothetical protein